VQTQSASPRKEGAAPVPAHQPGDRAAHPMKRSLLLSMVVPVAAIAALAVPAASSAQTPAARVQLAVGTQYDSTHVYVTPGSVNAFVTSWEATFGGTNTKPVVTDVTPTPSTTVSELVLSPVGTLSIFDYQTPAPYPFGAERTGWLVTNLDKGVRTAEADGADLVVSPFADPIGKDAVIQFPGGIDAQLYVHNTPPSYAPLTSVPQNRIYLSPDAADAFLHSYLRFTDGHVTSDNRHADGAQIGLPGTEYRRITISSPFGDTVLTVTDGHLPYPFGRETTGYSVTDLGTTIAKAQAAGAKVLWGPYTSKNLDSAILQFPGGYIAEIHSTPSH